MNHDTECTGKHNWKEVEIKSSLYAPCYHCYGFIVLFCMVSIGPVGNIECSIAEEGKEVAKDGGFSLPVFPAHHIQLRDDGHAFKVYREGPHDLQGEEGGR